MSAVEVNFDGLVGPTHNYAGLSPGNLASTANRGATSSPKRAALEGLAKMKLLHDMGVKQAVLPPQLRPVMRTLHALGLRDVEHAYQQSPHLLAACYSASAMWVANAATCSPAADTGDGRLHLTAANLAGELHRSLEAPYTFDVFNKIFHDTKYFVVHKPLPTALADEGGANHMRMCASHDAAGIEMFVYGRSDVQCRYPARQSLAASQAVARLHKLATDRVMFVQQNPIAIDAGVFHNDVIAVGNENVLLYHQHAFVQTPQFNDVVMIEVGDAALSLADAVQTYLFNSQLVTLPNGAMTLICPMQVVEHVAALAVVNNLVTGDNPVGSYHAIELRQSMRNGGGPACLRLRVVMTDQQLQAVHQGVLFSDALYEKLVVCVQQYYRDELKPDDLRDPRLVGEAHVAVDHIYESLGLHINHD